MQKWMHYQINQELNFPLSSEKISQIYMKRDLWCNMVLTLSRVENIKEGYFSERAQASILSYLLSLDNSSLIQSIPAKVDTLKDLFPGVVLLDG